MAADCYSQMTARGKPDRLMRGVIMRQKTRRPADEAGGPLR